MLHGREHTATALMFTEDGTNFVAVLFVSFFLLPCMTWAQMKGAPCKQGYCFYDEGGVLVFWMEEQIGSSEVVTGSPEIYNLQQKYNDWAFYGHLACPWAFVFRRFDIVSDTGWDFQRRFGHPQFHYIRDDSADRPAEFLAPDMIPATGRLSVRTLRIPFYMSAYSILRLWDELQDDCENLVFSDPECGTILSRPAEASGDSPLNERAAVLRSAWKKSRDFDALTKNAESYRDYDYSHLEPRLLPSQYLEKLRDLQSAVDADIMQAERMQRRYRLIYGDPP